MTRAVDVHALRYAHRTESYKGEHFLGYAADCHDVWPIDYFVWLVRTPDATVVLDSGFTPQEAARRGSRIYHATPIELLARLGVVPNEVTHLVLSHLHYDHTGYLDAFAQAQIVVQETEFAFWESAMSRRGSYAHLRPDGDLQRLRNLVDAGRVTLLAGDAEIVAGVSAHLVGGHTAGTQVLRVRTDDGPVVLASDASHFYANIDGDHPYGAVHDVARMHAAFDRLRELAEGGVVVPGHDPRVADRHETIADDVILLRPPQHSTSRKDSHAC